MRNERGMALLAVIAVLIALVLIGTPFALQMQSASQRSAGVLYTERAEQESQALISLANLYLLRGTDANEWAAAAKEGDAGAAGSAEGEEPKAFTTPDYDTPDELEIPASVIADFNRNSATGRIWDLRVEDEQAKVNLNSAPYTLLANLFGVARLSRDLDPDDTRVELSDGSLLPFENGTVRIGTELIRYKERDGTVLTGVERGFASDRPMNSEAQEWKEGELVINAVAFEIATYPIQARKGHFTPFGNPYQAKRIRDVSPVSVDPDSFDRTMGYLTCWSGREVAGGWCNAQRVESALPSSSSESEGDTVVVENARYFGPGTLVRITDGTNVDYSIVTKTNGLQNVTLGSQVTNEYEAGEAWIQTMARHPINVNTVSDAVLVACLMNVSLRGSDEYVTREAAEGLVPLIREKPLQSLRQWKELLDQARADGVITKQNRDVLYMNALNPQDAYLQFSTVPFCFKSYDVYTVKATAVVNSNSGREIARRSVRRVVSVNPKRSAVWSLDTQLDFENQIIAARTGKWMMTFPYNTGGRYEGINVPPSRLVPHLFWDVWPSTGQQSGVGDVRLQPERLNLPNVFHYDDSKYSDGYYMKDGPLPYSTRNRNVDLVDDDGMEPFAVGFWLKPYWGPSGGARYLMDCGEETWSNRVGIFYDGDSQELVFRLADATLENRSAEIRYKVDGGQLLEETWYHVSASAVGSKPGDMTLLVDGRPVGKPSYLTTLAGSVPSTGTVSELMVEDAESFPESGALIVRGADGPEIFEYDGRTSGSFSITRRFARMNSDAVANEDFPGMPHEEGEPVELLGYVQPMLTDLPVGGATLNSDLGKWHAMRVTFGEDVVYIPGDSGGGGGAPTDGTGGGGTPGGEPPAVPIQAVPPDDGTGGGGGGGGGGTDPSGTEIRGIASDRGSVTLELGSGIVAWDPNMDDQEALDAFGDKGFAVMVSPGPYEDLVPDEVIGGWEIVKYTKKGTALTVERYQTTRQIDAAQPHFFPQHSYGNPDAAVTIEVGGGESWQGFPSAIFPISVEASGVNEGAYFSVLDDTELQVTELNITRLYAQVGTEWFAYAYPDLENFSGSTVFVWDRQNEIQATVSLFEGGAVTVAAGSGGDGGTPPDDGTGGDDQPPEPPAPPDDGDDGGPPPDPDGGPQDPPPDDEPGPPPPDPDAGPGGEAPPPPEPEPDTGDDGPGDQPPPPPDPIPDDGDDGPGEQPPEPGEPELPPDGDGGPTDDPPVPPEPGDEPDPGDGGDGNEEPPPAEDPPDDGGSDGGANGGSGGGVGDDVPFLEQEIAIRLNHRSNGDLIVADTGAEVHEAGDEVRPTFLVTDYNGLLAGFDDRITLAIAEQAYVEFRIQHGVRRDRGQRWLSLTSFADQHYNHTSSALSAILAGTVNTRQVARIMKMPSGELPTGLSDDIYFGGRYDGSGFSPGMIDELYFPSDINHGIYRVGDGKVWSDSDTPGALTFGEGELLNADSTEFKIHMVPSNSNEDGLPIVGLPVDGGVLQIDKEIIAYSELDTASGTLKGCQRGALGTEPAVHGFFGRVWEVGSVTMALLDGEMADTAFEVQLNRIDGFPRTGGYVRVGDEVIAYTRIRGNSLIMPQDFRQKQDSEYDEGTTTGPGIFRGRFGTAATSHSDGEFVYLLASRYPDRFRDRSVDPAVSSIVIRKRVDGAIWKRVAWDEKVPDHTEVRVMVRFDGTPEWDSDRIYDVTEQRVTSWGEGRDQEAFRANPKSFLYLVESPDQENRFLPEGGIQADRIEVRIMFEYKDGAYTPYYGEIPSNSWKDTPWLKSMKLEYVAPATVHHTEDVR